MARYLVLQNNIVANVVEADADFAASQGWMQHDTAGIGWIYDGETFEPPVIVEPPPILPPLTRRQLRLALLSIGVTAEDIKTHIAAITDPVDRAAALIEWEDATHYKRDHPLVADIAAAMEMPPEQVDALWGWAAGV